MTGGVDLNESRVKTVTICYSIPIPLMLLFTGLRFFVKLRPSSKNAISFDDYMITVATAISVGLCISGLVYGPPYGFGRHQAALPDHEVESFLRGDYVFSHFYDWAIATIKLSILALYYRIFSTVVFRRVIIGTALFIICWLAAMEIGLGLECIPIERVWNSNVAGSCLDLVAFSYFTNITNLITDVWVFLLPLPIIFKLHVTQRRKFEVAGVFAVGLFTCGVTLARLTVVVSQGSSDFTWSGVPLGILSVWEPLCGIVCANLPFLYKLIMGFFRNANSYGSSQAGASASQSEYRNGQTAQRRHARRLSLHSEWMMISRNEKDYATTTSETRINQSPEIEMLRVQRSPSMNHSDTQEILER